MDPESSIEMETKATNTSQGASPPTMNVTLSPVTWSETEEAIILPFRGRDFEPQLSFNLSDEGGSTYGGIINSNFFKKNATAVALAF